MSTPAFTLSSEDLEEMIRRVVREERLATTAPSESSEVLTREQAASLLQVSTHYVLQLVREHGLPGHRLGREWRFRRGELLAWLSAQEGAA